VKVRAIIAEYFGSKLPRRSKAFFTIINFDGEKITCDVPEDTNIQLLKTLNSFITITPLGMNDIQSINALEKAVNGFVFIYDDECFAKISKKDVDTLLDL
jgi:hypothetical protein